MPVDVPARRAEADRLQIEAGNAGGDIESGLSLQADRLQSVSIRRTTDQEIAATADSDRGVGTDAAIASGKFAAPKPAVRRIHRPGKPRLFGEAEIDANPVVTEPTTKPTFWPPWHCRMPARTGGIASAAASGAISAATAMPSVERRFEKCILSYPHLVK